MKPLSGLARQTRYNNSILFNKEASPLPIRRTGELNIPSD
jgi:hypothetical protein